MRRRGKWIFSEGQRDLAGFSKNGGGGEVKRKSWFQMGGDEGEMGGVNSERGGAQGAVGYVGGTAM